MLNNGGGDARARCQQQRANAQQRDGFYERPQGRSASIRRGSSGLEERGGASKELSIMACAYFTGDTNHGMGPQMAGFVNWDFKPSLLVNWASDGT
eukprot:6210022-Pleurochrysis_carterae.AAC.3